MVTTNPFTTANYVEAVEALEKEIKEQADEIERLRDEVHFDDQTIKSLQVINERLKKKNEWLREALKLISEIMTHTFWSKDGVESIVRDALKEGE